MYVQVPDKTDSCHDTTTKCFGPVTGAQLSERYSVASRMRGRPFCNSAISRTVMNEPRRWQINTGLLCHASRASPTHPPWSYRTRTTKFARACRRVSRRACLSLSVVPAARAPLSQTRLPSLLRHLLELYPNMDPPLPPRSILLLLLPFLIPSSYGSIDGDDRAL